MADDTAKQGSKSGRLLRQLLFAAALMAGLAGAATYAAHNLAGSANGTVVAKKESSSAHARSDSSYELDGEYLSFRYPSSFTVSGDQPTDTGFLQQNRLSSTTAGSQSLVVTVSNLPSGQLADDPSYHMRELYPATYHLTLQAMHGERVVIAARFDSFEEIAFWEHAGKLATIALSGTTTNRSTAAASLSQLLQTVTWQ